MRATVAAIAAFFVLAAPAGANTYEVGPGKPYSSLQSVAPLLGAGDLVLVYGGTTYSGGLVLDRPGAAGARIVVRGVPVNGVRPRVSGGTNTIEVRANHYLLEGLEITGGSFRCLYHHADDVVARDLVIHGCPAHGVLGADDDSGSLTLEYSEVYDCGSGTFDHCIYMATDEDTYPGSVFRLQHTYVHDANGGNAVKSRAERNEIYYNWIEGALYHELELIGPDPAGGNDVPGVREDSDVVGNVLRKRNTFSVVRFGGDGTGASAGRYRFAFNTVLTQPGGSAVFRLFDSLESVEMHGNVFYGAGGAAVNLLRELEAEWVAGRVVGGSRNWVTSGSQNVPPEWTGTLAGGDPGFADLAGLDLRPGFAATIRDAGPTSTSSPPGHAFPAPLFPPSFTPPQHARIAPGGAVARPSDGTLDIGAFEYGAASQLPGAGVPSPGTGGSGPSPGSAPASGPGANGEGAADGRPPRASRVRVLRTRRGYVLSFRLSERASFSGTLARAVRASVRFRGVERLRRRSLPAGVRRIGLGRQPRGDYRVSFQLRDAAGNRASAARRFHAR